MNFNFEFKRLNKKNFHRKHYGKILTVRLPCNPIFPIGPIYLADHIHKCFPNIICPAIPNIYPFIVNDPGEGSQAKRRTAATIIDHLTPPLDRSELYGKYSILENYLDEYFEAKLLKSRNSSLIVIKSAKA